MGGVRSAVLVVLVWGTALPVHAAEPLGRLFMTPEQRRALDALRDPGGDVGTQASPVAAPVADPLDGKVVLNGVVSRSRGPDVVWVNGQRAGGTDDRIRLQRGPDATARVTLQDKADGTTARLKPGQYWEPLTGRVADCQGCSGPANVPEPAAENVPAQAEATADQP